MSTCFVLCLFNYLLSLNYLLVFSLSREVLVYLFCKLDMCLRSMNKYAMIWVTKNCNENI
jgi:hypothetical protein